ncbi:MAG: hypothetical protein MJ159_03805 [Treponemataceae bacterium]|nr:hypothetical protein [Treponemataceae bacterium]
MVDITSGLLSTYSYSYASTHNATGKVAVPVKPSMVIYSQLEHISGYADAKGANGISLNKVYMLNTLIDKVSSSTTAASTEKAKVTGLSEEQIDNLISDYQAQLQTKLSVAKDNPYAIVPTGLTGNAVDFVA